jgi:hypothetical protein
MRAPLSVWSLWRGFGPSALYGLLLVQACTSTATTLIPATAIGPGTTSVSVDPQSFLGAVSDGGVALACSDQPGSMRSFVATVTDVTDPETPFVLPSSPPTSCGQSAYFQYVTPGHIYVADVDAYEETPDQLVPVCGEAPVVQPSPGCQADGQPCTSPAQCCTNVCSPQTGKCGCAADTDCPIAYGCPGHCKVTEFKTPSDACIAACVKVDAGAPDAGATACDVAQANCPTSSDAAFAACILAACVQSDDSAHEKSACIRGCLATGFAQIQGECADAVLPAGGGVKACSCTYLPTEGNRTMLHKSDQSVASFRWQTPMGHSCGEPLPPHSCSYSTAPGQTCGSVAQSFVNVSLAPCPPLVDYGSATPTSTEVVVLPAAALPSGCTAAVEGGIVPVCCPVALLDGGAVFGGESVAVQSFDVLPPASSGLNTQFVTRCDPTPAADNPNDVALYTNVVPGASYQFDLKAIGQRPDGTTTVVAQSSCFATPIAGVRVTAMCDPLVATY